MSERAAGRLQRLFNSIRAVSNTKENHLRLWQCYQSAFISDEELLKAVGASGCLPTSINGVTEPLNIDDFEHALAMPDTLCLEVPAKEDEQDMQGFSILRYASTSVRSREVFEEYVFESALGGRPVKYVDSNAERVFRDALENGNVMCSHEVVARGSSTVAAALITASYKSVALDLLGSPDSLLIGKCLESVQIGSHVNHGGNIGIKKVVDGMSMKCIGIVEQTRELVTLTEEDSHKVAHLQFGLYMGNCAKIRNNAMRWGIAT